MEKIRNNISIIYAVSEATAMLDMLHSFAHASKLNSYGIPISFSQISVRPEFTDTLAISNGRHPIRESLKNSTTESIPNDVYASEESSMFIITGPNMVFCLKT